MPTLLFIRFPKIIEMHEGYPYKPSPGPGGAARILRIFKSLIIRRSVLSGEAVLIGRWEKRSYLFINLSEYYDFLDPGANPLLIHRAILVKQSPLSSRLNERAQTERTSERAGKT